MPGGVSVVRLRGMVLVDGHLVTGVPTVRRLRLGGPLVRQIKLRA
jgi:hypothetical protein